MSFFGTPTSFAPIMACISPLGYIFERARELIFVQSDLHKRRNVKPNNELHLVSEALKQKFVSFTKGICLDNASQF